MQSQILTNTDTFTVARQNKRAKPYKPFGLAQRHSPSTASHLSREPSPDEISQPLSSTLRQSQAPTDCFTHSRTPTLSAVGSKPPSRVSKPPSRASKPPSHASKPTSCTPKPLSCQYAVADITSMPVDDYGGFHDEDETIEQEFALKHKRTTSNSKVYTSIPIVVDITVLTFHSALLVLPAVLMKNLTRNLSSEAAQLATRMQRYPGKFPPGSRTSSSLHYWRIVAQFQTRGFSNSRISSQTCGKLCSLECHTMNSCMVQEQFPSE